MRLNERFENSFDLVTTFFTLIAPGGRINKSSKKEISELFCELGDPQLRRQLESIKAICEKWAKSDSYDNIPVIKEIMLVLIPEKNLTWFGFNKNDRPPNQGFFVDKVFEIKEE